MIAQFVSADACGASIFAKMKGVTFVFRGPFDGLGGRFHRVQRYMWQALAVIDHMRQHYVFRLRLRSECAA